MYNLSLVVPVFNNADLAINGILKTLSFSKLINEIIIYSNGSDESENEKLKNFEINNPIVKLHIIDRPIGYIKSVNELFKLSKNDLILCMNSDAEMYGDWENRLKPLIDDKENGLIGPVLSGDFILGCCFIVRKSILNKIGFLNEGFGFGYYDDNELSYRVKMNKYNLGYSCSKKPDEWGNSVINFPIVHKQGLSFIKLNNELIKGQKEINQMKFDNIKSSTDCIVLKNLNLETIKKYINKTDLIYVVNYSGEEFEKIRFDQEIITHCNIFECTKEMNIDVLIESLTVGKQVKIIDNYRNNLISQLSNKINFRYDIINSLIVRNNYKRYLEIGVRNPDECFNLVECELKHGVDPMVEGEWPVTYKMTSDDFFTKNTQKYDIIFIDGLHLDYQVERDIKNSLSILNENGSIVLHDCNPADYYHQREDYDGGGWNGTVWKAVVKLRSEMDDIFTCVVNIDHGVGIIRKTKNHNKIVNDNLYFSYNKFVSNKKYYLNLISVEEFVLGYVIDFEKEQKKETISMTWLAKFDDHSSMGILSQKVLENLKNVNLSCKEIIGVSETKNDFILNLIQKENNHDLGIMFSYPDMIGMLDEFKTKVIYTGVDSTGGISNFANNCNKADFLITPSKISKKRMENLGVTKPIFVFPHGVEKNKFKFRRRYREEKFKFLYVGECSERKGTFHLVNAFIDLFGNNPNVQLILRSNDAMIFYGGETLKEIISDHENIIWNHSNTTHDELVKLYDECHAYVYPSRADTFGMTLLEAMSSGLPIISTDEPGSTELIEGRYDKVHSELIQIDYHPWMLGKWGSPSYNGLKSKMKWVFENYEKIDWNEIENHSKYVNEELNWEKLTEKFETTILPQLKKNVKVLTILTSYERPNHIPNVIDSFKNIRERGITNHVYIVENSESQIKNEIINIINSKIDENFTLYVSEFNMGQRGALLQVLDMVDIDDYDFIQFSDQDNIFKEPLSTYCDILLENQDITFVTGYMSKEHGELGWRQTRFGNLCEKRSLRAGHMFMRVSDLKKLFPLHLDAHYGQPYNSSWNAGLDWELTYWNPNSIGKNSNHNFVLCVPGGVLHVGYDSTIYDWPVQENEYTDQELELMR